MEMPRARIMLVESDQDVSDLIARQTLRPIGYQVDVMDSASTALKEFENLSPDLIITNLQLPGISGKDLLVALTSQGINLPIIVITPKGDEADALQAFRLGALNFLTYPLREAEVLNVVEDTLKLFHQRNELKTISNQVDQSKKQIEQYISDLVEIFSIGKLVPSAANQQTIYEKIIAAAVQVSQADAAWILVMDFQKNKYILRASQDPESWLQSKLNQPYEDTISTLVTLSGQAISLHADSLVDYNLPDWVKSILAVPIKWKNEIAGLFCVARSTPQPFTTNQQALLEVIADYASALIENARHYQILEQRLYNLQQSKIYTLIDADLKNDLLHQAGMELRRPLINLVENLNRLTHTADRRLSLRQTDAMTTIREESENLMDIVDAMIRIHQGEASKILEEIDINKIVREVVSHWQGIAQVCRITLKMELPVLPVYVVVFPSQITRVIEGLISNTLKYSPSKSQVTITVEKKNDSAVFSMADQGEGISVELVEKIFSKKSSIFGEEANRFGGIGISLPMVREIITAHKGEVWVDSGYGKGYKISFSLPLL